MIIAVEKEMAGPSSTSSSKPHVEQLIDEIVAMDRGELIAALRQSRCGFSMDFSEDFLNSLSLDRLKHIVLAASLHAHRG